MMNGDKQVMNDHDLQLKQQAPRGTSRGSQFAWSTTVGGELYSEEAAAVESRLGNQVR